MSPTLPLSPSLQLPADIQPQFFAWLAHCPFFNATSGPVDPSLLFPAASIPIPSVSLSIIWHRQFQRISHLPADSPLVTANPSGDAFLVGNRRTNRDVPYGPTSAAKLPASFGFAYVIAPSDVHTSRRRGHSGAFTDTIIHIMSQTTSSGWIETSRAHKPQASKRHGHFRVIRQHDYPYYVSATTSSGWIESCTGSQTASFEAS